MRLSYAQNKEDIILQGFFPDSNKGFYVDIGANHPIKLSVTKLFYEKGWRGINIEPNSYLYDLIVSDRKNDMNLNIGIADRATTLVMREYPEGDGLSTFEKESQKSYENKSSEYHKFTAKHIDRKVIVRPLRDVLAEYAGNKTINFMSIDVEGFEYEVIKGNDWEKYRPQVICIEANHIVKDWRPLLAKANYILVFFDGLNNYYVAKEHHELADSFSYVKAVLMDGPITPKPIADQINMLQSKETALESRVVQLKAINQNLNNEIQRLNNHIAEQQRLRTSIRHLVLVLHRIILLNIDKLNKPPKKALPKISPELRIDLSPEERIRELWVYDVMTYYNYAPRRRVAYKLVKTCYKGSMRIIFILARTAYRIWKKVRGALR